jgi:hypothetical protein
MKRYVALGSSMASPHLAARLGRATMVGLIGP